MYPSPDLLLDRERSVHGADWMWQWPVLNLGVCVCVCWRRKEMERAQNMDTNINILHIVFFFLFPNFFNPASSADSFLSSCYQH